MMAELFSENFDTFRGTGFAPVPSSGQLDSDRVRVTGLSDGDLSFGGTADSGDFARGITTGGVSTGGVYAFDRGNGDYALGVQPTGSDFMPGTLEFAIMNISGEMVSTIALTYDILTLNDQPRANSFNLEYAIGSGSFSAISSLDFTTPETADSSPVFVTTTKSITLENPTFLANETLFLRFKSNDVSGSGSRDEIGLDNLVVESVPSTPGIAIVESNATTIVSESGDTDSYTIALKTDPSATVTLRITAPSATEIARDGSTFSTSLELDFTDTTPQTITVRAIDDATADGDRDVTIQHDIIASNAADYPTTQAVDDVTVMIREDDSAIDDGGEIFISEYIEGSSNNKAIELFNPTGATIELDGYRLDLYSDTNSNETSPTQSVLLDDYSISSTGTFVIAHGSAETAILNVADYTNSLLINFNGDDTIVLRKNGAVIDAIGQIGHDPGDAWGSGMTSTQDHTLRRKPNITRGDGDATDTFDPTIEWEGFAIDTAVGLGQHLITDPPSPNPPPTTPGTGSPSSTTVDVEETSETDQEETSAIETESAESLPAVALASSPSPSRFTELIETILEDLTANSAATDTALSSPATPNTSTETVTHLGLGFEGSCKPNAEGAQPNRDQPTPGDDCLQRDDRDDLLILLAGHDVVSTGNGNDIVAGNQGRDYIETGNDDDLAFGGKDSDTLIGGAGNDVLLGDWGEDGVNGGAGDDWLFGGRDRDTLTGEAGADRLYGGKEADILDGGSGDDWLSGDLGDDTLIGGDGADTFVVGLDRGNETIVDFTPGDDRIELVSPLTFASLSIETLQGSTIIRHETDILATLTDAIRLEPTDFVSA
jgi:Ca2+-binding RTX toxin-like protein